MSAEQNSTQCAANELGVVLRLGGIGIRKLTNLSVGPAGRYVPLASQSSRALPLPVRRKGGRPALPLAARRRNAEHLGRQVITSAEEGWRKYPGDGPTRQYVAAKMFTSATALRHRLRRSGLSFEELSAEARDRVFGRSWTRLGS